MDGKLYIMLAKIDEGSFGDIFSVHRYKDKNIYALKQIKYRGDLKNDPYILNEIENLSRLNHENIVTLKDVIISPNTVNIVMELAEKGNLEKYVLLNGGLHGQQLQQIFRQILSAVDFCHKCNVAHRDLTPSNILLTDQMVVKLADFGLSMVCRNKAGDVILCEDYLGNTSYLAPEVILEEPHDPLLADIWSIGVLLFFLISCKVPFNGDTMEILFQQQNIQKLLYENKSVPALILQPKISDIMINILKIIPKSRPSVHDIRKEWEFESMTPLSALKTKRDFLCSEKGSRGVLLRQV